MTRFREAFGWSLFLLVAHVARLPKWIAGPGVIEARIASLSWLERRPRDYDADSDPYHDHLRQRGIEPDDVDERRTW